jgi:hypothetical protein
VDCVKKYFVMLDFSKEYSTTMDLVKEYYYQVEESLIKYPIDVSKIYLKYSFLLMLNAHQITFQFIHNVKIYQTISLK